MSKINFSEGSAEQIERCVPHATARETVSYQAREKSLGGGLKIRRALPLAKRRLIGAFCFLDHFGPAPLERADAGMDVASHPHIGLQTVTWLVDGAILHHDSLGSRQLIRPGQLNVMTAGHGISHSEETPAEFEGTLHGVQLWVALPEERRHGEAAFEHHAEVPRLTRGALELSLVVGSAFGHTSPATSYSKLVAMEILVKQGGSHRLELESNQEYGVIVLDGAMQTDQGTISPGTLYFMSTGHDCFEFETSDAARLFLVGGEVFEEEILMYWNFVGRTRDEIAQATEQWNAGDERFGEVRGYTRGRLDAPSVGPLRG